jgi:hypothetical protein
VNLNESSAYLCVAELLPLQKAHGAGKLAASIHICIAAAKIDKKRRTVAQRPGIANFAPCPHTGKLVCKVARRIWLDSAIKSARQMFQPSVCDGPIR